MPCESLKTFSNPKVFGRDGTLRRSGSSWLSCLWHAGLGLSAWSRETPLCQQGRQSMQRFLSGQRVENKSTGEHLALNRTSVSPHSCSGPEDNTKEREGRI